jgi:hypothetical protein
VKLFPFPTPGYVRKGDWDFSTQVIRWMGRCGLRELNQRHKLKEPLPDHDELSAWLYGIAMDRGSRWFTVKGAGRFRKDIEKVPKMASDAATYVFAKWRPEYIEGKIRGGAEHSRGKSFTVADLDRVPGLSIKKQAEALGCSAATISTLRARARAAEAEVRDADTKAQAIADMDDDDRLLLQLDSEIKKQALAAEPAPTPTPGPYDDLLDDPEDAAPARYRTVGLDREPAPLSDFPIPLRATAADSIPGLLDDLDFTPKEPDRVWELEPSDYGGWHVSDADDDALLQLVGILPTAPLRRVRTPETRGYRR